MDLNKLSVTELKALAYDTGAQMSRLQQKLQLINQTIMRKSQEKPTVTKKNVK